MRSQKFPCPPFTPNSFGNCVLASCSATPPLKPIRTVSETKFTTEPARTSHARNAIVAVNSAMQAAIAPKRAGSPPAMLPSDEQTSSEIAEVTLIHVCRELHKSQNTSPPNKHAESPACGGKPASDASPSAAGSTYAASVTPATRSERNH